MVIIVQVMYSGAEPLLYSHMVRVLNSTLLWLCHTPP